jgi:outer membrane protein assembly factor BamB
MKHSFRISKTFVAACLVGCGILLSLMSQANAQDDERLNNWGQWRGPLGTGVAPKADPPTEWGLGKNIKWKAVIPGLGHSSPVVWRERVFVTTAVPFGDRLKNPKPDVAPGAHDNLLVTHQHKFVVMALARQDGDILWQQEVTQGVPREGAHNTASLASNSPMADAKHVYAFFGSRGLYCFTHAGKLVWDKHFKEMQTKHAHGEGASPVLSGDTIVVNWDHEGQSFVVAIDKNSGKEIWKLNRDEVTSWASPIVVKHGGKTQVVVSGTRRVRSYDIETGKILWECGGLSNNVVASPVAADGMVFAASSYETRSLLAISLEGAQGNITNTKNVVWSTTQRTPYVPSPLLYKGSLYYLRHYQNILTRIEAKTGNEKIGPFRLDGIGNIYASPVAAAGRVYIVDLRGATLVISHNDPKPLATNRLPDSFAASPALVGNEIFLRGQRHLYCIANDAK